MQMGLKLQGMWKDAETKRDEYGCKSSHSSPSSTSRVLFFCLRSHADVILLLQFSATPASRGVTLQTPTPSSRSPTGAQSKVCMPSPRARLIALAGTGGTVFKRRLPISASCMRFMWLPRAVGRPYTRTSSRSVWVSNPSSEAVH